MPLSPRTRLGSYEILGPLGAGGMGEVYRAQDLRLRREIALKVLPAEVASSPDRLARFEREARTVATLNHPNIVTLHSVEDADGIRFLTMELVEGQTLSTLIEPGGLPLPKLLELAIPLTEALVAAHEKRVIHRDLKPGNVMVTRDGRVKVLDFGLAKMMGADTRLSPGASATMAMEPPISGEGQVVGTVPYMAPEQLRGETTDVRTDLFSLGIILYELATGSRPFTGETSIDVSHAILHETPKPLNRARADLPGELVKLIDHCLEKNPRERIQTALDVNYELRRMKKMLQRGERETPVSDKAASIAVLPFVNRSASADDEYFSDGLADELLSVLSKIKGLRVTARASSFHFKGKNVPVPEIGRVLNVATLLDGSVRKAGNRIRVSVQLVSVADSSHLWSETYDRTLEDIFAVQDDIAQSVVKELRTTLLGEEADSDASGAAKAEVAQAARGRGTDPEAHRLYLLARHLVDRRTREHTTKAIGYLKQAIAQDPSHALAWAELGRAYASETEAGWLTSAEGFEQARIAVERALSLEPDLAEGQAVLGRLKMSFYHDWKEAEALLVRAMELAPSSAPVLLSAGLLEYSLCRIDAAIDLFRRASEQDPLSATAYHCLGLALQAADRLEEAETAYRKALELSPARVGTRALLSMALPALGRTEEALLEVRNEPDEGYRLWALVLAYHAADRQAEATAALRDLTEKHADTMAFQIAQTYAALGEANAAFDWLERAYLQKDPGLGQMEPSPRFRSLHGDPRWVAFLKKMGLAG